jgi:transposase
MRKSNRTAERVPVMYIGIDLGDRYSEICILTPWPDDKVESIETDKIRTCATRFRDYFSLQKPAVVVLEIGQHSHWVSAVLKECGHEVIVANARRVALIYNNSRKRDKTDAESLARLGRMDRKLLSPIEHRGREAQLDLALVRSRSAIVRARSLLINHIRSTVKVFGERLPTCDAHGFDKKVRESIPKDLQAGLLSVLEQVRNMTKTIKEFDAKIEAVAEKKYPETKRLEAISGVGTLTALTYVLTIEEPKRFQNSRQVGAYLGLVPRMSESGSRSPQLRISKEGDEHLRSLLVCGAHYILGPFGPDCNLRRHGATICNRGGKNAKKRAVVAVARKLAVLMHRLWVSKTDYDPFYKSKREPRSISA